MIHVLGALCVDEEKEDKHMIYPAMMGYSSEQRRLLYWEFAVVMASTIRKVYPEFGVTIFTNDQKPIIIGKTDVRKFMADLEVNIEYLPFKKYRYPIAYGKSFRNAFYKMDVIAHIGQRQDNDHYLLTDTDCLWMDRNDAFVEKIHTARLMLYDIFQRTPEDKGHINLSRLDLGVAFRDIMGEYSVDAPIHWGGEFVSGTPEVYREADKHMEDFYNKCIEVADATGQPPRFKNDHSLFDGMEYFYTYAFNLMEGIELVNPYLQRIIRLPHFTNVSEKTYDITIWHLLQEKKTGMRLLYQQCLDKQSAFWTCEVSDFRKVVGEYVGLPERKYFYKEEVSLKDKIKSMVYRTGKSIGVFK